MSIFATKNRIVEFFALKRSMVALLSMVILVGLGEYMAERFLPIYLMALGGGVLSVGLLNGMDNLLSALYSFPGGYLSDRLGYKKALLLFNIIALFGYLIVILIPTWYAVLFGAIFFLSWSAISLPATLSLVGTVLPKNKHVMGVSIHSLVRRIPMGLGPIIGGGFVAYFGEVDGVRLAFVFAAVLAIVSVWLQQRLVEEPRKELNAKEAQSVESNPLKVMGKMSSELKHLLISDILIRFSEQIPYAFIAIWCIKDHGISPVTFGVLTAIEMTTAMLVYIPVAYFADKAQKKPFVLITFVNFSLFPLLMLISDSVAMFVVAFIVRGLKEFGEPTRKSLIMDLADEKNKAGMFGAYYLARDIVVSVAAFSGAYLWYIAPRVNMLVAFAFGVIGCLYFWKYGRDVSLKKNDGVSVLQ